MEGLFVGRRCELIRTKENVFDKNKLKFGDANQGYGLGIERVCCETGLYKVPTAIGFELPLDLNPRLCKDPSNHTRDFANTMVLFNLFCAVGYNCPIVLQL